MLVKALLADQPTQLPFINGEKSVAHALDLMSGSGFAAVLIGSAVKPSGIFTPRDILRCRRNFPDRKIQEVQVQEVMTSKLVVAEPGDTVEQAMAMMIQAKIRHLPVVADRKIIGLVGLEDLVKTHVGALTQELHYLKDYISDLQDAVHD